METTTLLIDYKIRDAVSVMDGSSKLSAKDRDIIWSINLDALTVGYSACLGNKSRKYTSVRVTSGVVCHMLHSSELIVVTKNTVYVFELLQAFAEWGLEREEE